MKILSSLSVLLLIVLTGVLSANFVLAVERIDINIAPLEDLIKIIHIGEARANELISLRPFSSLDELTKIKGIGDSRVEDIKKQELAWVNEIYKVDLGPEKEKELAAAGELIEVKPQSDRSLVFIPPIAGAIAVFSGIIILVLKKKLKTG